jgi:hypothetical protein
MSDLDGRDRRCACPFHSHEGAISGLRKKLCVDQGAKQSIADVALQTPQPPGLRGCQSKSGHFKELALDPLEHFVDTHWLPSARSAEVSKLLTVSKNESNPCTGPLRH